MTGAPSANRLAAFVVGAGHSGSTLLGVTLGAHPAVFYAGEARKSIFLGDPTKPRKKRVCKLCGERCPVWGSFVPTPGVDLYEQLSRLTGRPVVLDSTKSPEWIEERAAEVHARGGDARLFLLQRDGRAVVASRHRKYPETSFAEHARTWATQITEARRFAAAFPGPVLDVRYERMAKMPRRELERAAAFLGLPFAEEMLAPWSAPLHPLGGNNGTQWLLARSDGEPLELSDEARAYYAEHPRAIVLDERWRTELDEAELATFEQEAGEANRDTAWEEP